MTFKGWPERATGITLREAIETSKQISPISSGSEAIDFLLDGGYRVGEIVEIFGESNTGKTQLAMQAALSCASRGFSVLFVDTEGTFRPERLESMARAKGWGVGEILPLVYRLRAADASAQFEALTLVNTRRELKDCRMTIVDTVTKNFSIQYPGRTNLPKRQGLLDAYLSEIGRSAFIDGMAVLLTNRVTSFSTAAGSREVHIGGDTLSQMVHRTIHLTRRGEKVRAALVVGDVEVNSREAVINERGFN